MVNAGSQGGATDLIVFPVSAAGSRLKGFYLFKNFHVGGVTLCRDAPLLDKLQYGTAWLRTMATVAEFTGHITVRFKAGEKLGQLFDRYIDQTKIAETGGVNQLTATCKGVQCGNGGGVSSHPLVFTEAAHLEVYFRAERVEQGTLADTGCADKGTAMSTAQKLFQRGKSAPFCSADGKYLHGTAINPFQLFKKF